MKNQSIERRFRPNKGQHYAKYLTFKKGDLIYMEDDPFRNVLKVIEGSVILSKDHGHKCLSIQIVGKGEYIYLTELVNNMSSVRCSAIALGQKTVLQSFSKSSFNELLKNDVDLAALLLKQMIEMSESAWVRYVNKKSYGIKETVAKGLIELVSRSSNLNKGKLYIEGISHEELAKYLAISRQSVTMSLNELRVEKKIRYSRMRPGIILESSLFEQKDLNFLKK